MVAALGLPARFGVRSPSTSLSSSNQPAHLRRYTRQSVVSLLAKQGASTVLLCLCQVIPRLLLSLSQRFHVSAQVVPRVYSPDLPLFHRSCLTTYTSHCSVPSHLSGHPKHRQRRASLNLQQDSSALLETTAPPSRSTPPPPLGSAQNPCLCIKSSPSPLLRSFLCAFPSSYQRHPTITGNPSACQLLLLSSLPHLFDLSLFCIRTFRPMLSRA